MIDSVYCETVDAIIFSEYRDCWQALRGAKERIGMIGPVEWILEPTVHYKSDSARFRKELAGKHDYLHATRSFRQTRLIAITWQIASIL